MLWRPRAALADVVAVTLGTNISSMRAQRSLDRTGDALRTIFERLSSGARINRAADDAAGLAVSMSLSTRARVLARSDRNVQDGISAINIADGALGQVSNTLTRMAELAQQASNGSLGRFQRMSLHQEYRALGDEIRRISETTQFNGIKLLAGTRSTDTGTIIFQPDQASQQDAKAVSASGRYALIATDDGLSTLGWNIYDRVTNTSTNLVQNSSAAPATMDALGNVVYSDGTNLFRYDVSTRATTKLTNSSVSTNYNGLQISADGSRLAFTSTTQFTDGASLSAAVSSTGSARLYAVDLSSSAQTIRRVTQATFGLTSDKQLSLSSDGSKVFFASNSNLAGSNADGNWEIYGADLTAATLSVSQVTNTTGVTASIGFLGATMKATNDGRVYFTDSRNYTGQNGAGSVQLFSGSLAGSMAQIGNMNLTAGMLFSLSADESSISFLSARNLIGENPTLSYQAYRIDLGNGTLTQLSNFTNTANVTPDQAVFSGDGRVMYGNIAGNYTSQYGYSVIDIGSSASSVDISTGNGSLGGIGVLFASLASALEGISGFTLTSAASARGALDSVMASIQNIASARGQLGAGAARLETASRVLTTQVQESKAANSRIVDADIASESAQLVRNQILQQSASAVLAQANQQPAITLSLLRIS